MSSPDMDVDVGGTPEPESIGADDMARDGESDLVVQQLERGLPRWEEGLGDFGWLKEKEGSEDRRLELVLAIKGHKDTVYVSSPSPRADLNVPFSGNRYATALEAMPEETNIPYLSFSVCHASCLTPSVLSF
jgi:chromatin structure-remodeling complex subunit RSC1/2